MPDIALHRHTHNAISAFLSQPHHALLMTGPEGVGKLFTARYVAAARSGIDVANLAEYPGFKLVTAEKGKTGISIESVRQLRHFTRLRQTGGDQRIIVIHDAHTMSEEAQNALLKLLEEPPELTSFILTSESDQSVLPTIRSRSQVMAVHPAAPAELLEFFTGSGHEAAEVQRALSLAGGLPGLAHALLNDTDHPMRSAVDTARKLLQSSQFERLTVVDSLSKQKSEALHVLFILQHMARTALERSANNSTDPVALDKSIRQWHRIRQAAYDAQKAYAVSGQAKLTLTNLMLSL